MSDPKFNLNEFDDKIFPESRELKLTNDIMSKIEGCVPPNLLEYVRWTIHSVLNSNRIDEIVSKLEENMYVDVIDAEKLGVKWKILKIRLRWFTKSVDFDVFISSDTISDKDFESNEEYLKNSYSSWDIAVLLRSINEWLNENWLITDNLNKYDSINSFYHCHKGSSMVSDFLRKISCQDWKPLIDGRYFLCDTYPKKEWNEYCKCAFFCNGSKYDEFEIMLPCSSYDWHLFLKI